MIGVGHDGQRPFSRFSIAGAPCAIPLERVAAIARLEHRKADAGDGEVGEVRIGARAIPVIDLASRLGLPAAAALDSPTVVVAADPPWAFPVDSIPKLIIVDPEAVFPAPALLQGSMNGGVRDLIVMGNDVVFHIEPEQMRSGSSPRLPHVRGREAFHGTTSVGGSSTSGVVVVITPPAAAVPVRFCLSLSQVLEIVDEASVTPIPAAPPALCGMIVWRNRPVPLVDLPTDLAVGHPEYRSRDRRILIARTAGGMLLAILVQPAIRLRRLPLDCTAADPDPIFDLQRVRGFFDYEGHPLVVPDLDVISGNHDTGSMPLRPMLQP